MPAYPHWQRATTINPGDPVRIAVAVADMAAIGKILGPNASAVLSTFFDLQAATDLLNYAQGDALPDDWPADDTHRGAEVHSAFTYNGPGPIQVAWLGIPIQVWTLVS
jgi:hypothetical protein